MNPEFIIARSERTRAGALATSVVQRIRLILTDGGFVLLPSDTCYSLATHAVSDAAHDSINRILGRKKAPISLAFASYLEVQQFVHVDQVSAILLERFSPGPITVVCKALDRIPNRFLTGTIASERRTIGVRIPDSAVERDVAACVPYPITTVAIRDEHENAVRDFATALAIVKRGIDRFGGARWCAVEGGEFYANHSTVVEPIAGTRELKLYRAGDIPFPELLAASEMVPGLALEGPR